MKIRFLGKTLNCSFTKDTFYFSSPVNDEYGGYAIEDDSADTYRYSEKFVKENFEEIKE